MSPQVGGSDKRISPGERTKIFEKKGAYTNISVEVNGQEVETIWM